MEKDREFIMKFFPDAQVPQTISALLRRNIDLKRDKVLRRMLLDEVESLNLMDFVMNHHLRNLIGTLIKEKTYGAAANVLFYIVGPKRDDLTGKHTQGGVAVDSIKGPWHVYNYRRHCWNPPSPNWMFKNVLHAIMKAYETVVHEFCVEKENGWLKDGTDVDQLHVVRRGLNEVMLFVSGGMSSRAAQVENNLASSLINRSPTKKKISELLDANPFVLGLPPSDDTKRPKYPGGVFDLIKCKFRPGRPDDYISKQMKDAYIPFKTGMKKVPGFKERYNEWRRFFRNIVPDEKTCEYLLKAFASALGGHPPELLFILTGHGSNGKSKLFEFVEMAFDNYYVSTSSTKLTEKRPVSTAADPQQARLGGARIRFDEEPEEGASLNMSSVKERFNKQTVRPLYGEPITQMHFYRHFLSCNSIPEIHGADKAAKRRFIFIEMLVNFVKEGDAVVQPNDWPADVNLTSRFPELTQSFISYLLELWKANKGQINLEGSAVPKVIKDKNNEIFRDMNLVETFMSEKIVGEPTARLTFAEIWKAWDTYEKEMTGHSKTVIRVQKNVFRRLLNNNFTPVVLQDGQQAWKCHIAGEMFTSVDPTGESGIFGPELIEGLHNPEFEFMENMINGASTDAEDSDQEETQRGGAETFYDSDNDDSDVHDDDGEDDDDAILQHDDNVTSFARHREYSMMTEEDSGNYDDTSISRRRRYSMMSGENSENDDDDDDDVDDDNDSERDCFDFKRPRIDTQNSDE